MSDLIFTGEGKEIAAALGHLSSSISRNSTLPILSCYALSVRRGELVATATDLDAQHSMTLPVVLEGAKEGAGACAAAGLFAGLLARCNGDGARVSIGKDELSVVAGGRKASMRVLPLSEFPDAHHIEHDWHAIDGAPLAAAIRGIGFATSNEETRYVLNGIYLDAEGMAVATDGRRLAQVRYTSSPAPCLAGAILPNRALDPIADLLERHDRVEVAGDGSGVAFRAKGESFFTKVIEGGYPNYRQVIPAFHDPVRVTVGRAALAKALAWAKLYRTSKDTAAKLYAADGQLTIRVSSPDIGEAEEALPLIRGEGVTMQAAINLIYLEQMVARDGGEHFRLECEPEKSGHLAGTVMGPLTVLEDNNPDFLGVLMPMRLA